jgi:hypothetical protein
MSIPEEKLPFSREFKNKNFLGNLALRERSREHAPLMK